MPAVSVLLTTWNRPALLRAAVKSVQRQTFTDWELIILDDDSDDPAQIRQLARCWRLPKTRVYKDTVPAGTRKDLVRYAVLANAGLQLARGRYVTYLCDDDRYLPRRLELMAARLDRGDCQAVYGRQKLRYADGHYEEGVLVTEDRILEDAWHQVDHSSVMHTRQAGLDVGGWDEDPKNWRDADGVFWRRLNAAGHKFYPVCAYTDVRLFHDKTVSVGNW